MDKAKGELLKVRKKSQRKKPTEKYEDKEKQVKYSILMFTANKDFIQILFRLLFVSHLRYCKLSLKNPIVGRCQ